MTAHPGVSIIGENDIGHLEMRLVMAGSTALNIKVVKVLAREVAVFRQTLVEFGFDHR